MCHLSLHRGLFDVLFHMPFVHHRGLFNVLFGVPVIRSSRPFQRAIYPSSRPFRCAVSYAICPSSRPFRCAVSSACYSFIKAFSLCYLCVIYPSSRPVRCAVSVFYPSSRPFRCAVCALLSRSFYWYPLSTVRVFSGVLSAHRYFVLVHLFK